MSLIRLLVALASLLSASAASADWRRAESPHFVLFSEEPGKRLRERILQLEDFHWLMGLATSAKAQEPTNKLHVYVVDNQRDLNTVMKVEDQVAGYYAAGVEGILAVVNSRVPGAKNHVLFHEYAHHFMLQYAPGAYPAWYVEGFAEYFGVAELKPKHVDIGLFSEGRVYSLIEGQWLPIERVLSGGPEGLSEAAGAAYYAQAWLMTHFFYSTPERQALLMRYLRLSKSDDPVADFRTATGMTPEAFTRELRRYIGRGSISYRRLTRQAAAPPAVTIARLPASADDLLLLSAALKRSWPEKDAPAFLAKIRSAAAKHPNDPFARRTLAHAELRYGDRAAALALLEQAQAQEPADAELLYLRGRLHLENAEAGGDWDTEVKAAELWFARAFRRDPNHYQTLYRFAQSQRRGSEALSENTSNSLLLAQQLAPQVVEIRLNAAAHLIGRGDVDRAEYLLLPVMSDPHDRQLARSAREMIEEARSAGASVPAEADAAAE